jgi:uncharacterized protein YjlB
VVENGELSEVVTGKADQEVSGEATPEPPRHGGDASSPPEAEVHVLADDGLIPNNGKLPLILYRHAVALEDAKQEPERAVEALFAANGWLGAWVDGIYDFHHYHSTAHEVLGIAAGSAKVQLGGPNGLVRDLEAGDVLVIPAGVGHCLIAGNNLVVVGAYPDGQRWDLCRASEADRLKALENIPWVPLPKFDPVFGSEGLVLTRWVD